MTGIMKTTQIKLLKPLGAALGVLLCLAPGMLRAQTPPGDGWTFPVSLDSFSFEDVSNWTSDSGVAPVSFSNIVGVAHEGDINSDYALLVDSTNPAWLTFALTNQTVTNLMLPAGSLTLWVAPADWASASTNGTGPGTRAELLSAGQWTTNASIGYWGLSISPDGNNLIFSAQTNSGDGATATYLTAPISWNTNEWHSVGLVWSETNSAMYLEGQLVTNGADVAVLPGPSVTNMSIGSDSLGSSQSRCLLDDIYTFGTNMDSTNMQNIFDSEYYEFFLNPYNASLYSSDENPLEEYGTNLAVTVAGISNGIAALLATNTIPENLYEIQSATNLPGPWTSEGFVYGSELTNWTAATVPEDGRPILFLRLRSWQDSSGTGIPDWWWLQYFGTNGVDPWTYDPIDDGYRYFDEFQLGLVPGVWATPAAPKGLAVQYHASSQTATVSWLPSPGPVQGYTVQKWVLGPDLETNFNFSANATSFQDSVPYSASDLVSYGPDIYVTYSAQAHYTAGDSDWSAPVPLENSYNIDPAILQSGLRGQLATGPQSELYLAVNSLPPGITALRIWRDDPEADTFGDSSFDTNWDISVSSLTNDVGQLPNDIADTPMDTYGFDEYTWYLQGLDASNNPSAPVPIGSGYQIVPDFFGDGLKPFYDGRQQMKQNLQFLLRAPNSSGPFRYYQSGPGSFTAAVSFPYN